MHLLSKNKFEYLINFNRKKRHLREIFSGDVFMQNMQEKACIIGPFMVDSKKI